MWSCSCSSPHAPCSPPGIPGGSASPGPGGSSSTQGCPACSHSFGSPTLLPVCHGSPKFMSSMFVSQGIHPDTFQHPQAVFLVYPMPRDNFLFFAVKSLLGIQWCRGKALPVAALIQEGEDRAVWKAGLCRAQQ